MHASIWAFFFFCPVCIAIVFWQGTKAMRAKTIGLGKPTLRNRIFWATTTICYAAMLAVVFIKLGF